MVFLHILCVHHSPSPKRVCVLAFFTVVTFVFGAVVIEVWDTQLPMWAFVLSIIIRESGSTSLSVVCLFKFFQPAFVFIVPNGVITAMTNNYVDLSFISELIIGYALPHHPIAMMMFKSWGSNIMNQVLVFTGLLKIGHYMKIPHRPMFLCLVIGTIVSGTVQLGVQAWMFSHVDNLCSSNQKDNFICPETIAFGSASIIVGPHLDGPFSFTYAFSVGCHWTSAYLFSRSPLQ